MKTFLLAIFLSFGCIVFASDFGAYIGSEKKDVLASIESIAEKKTIVVEIEDFTKDDVKLINYQHNEQIKNIPVGHFAVKDSFTHRKIAVCIVPIVEHVKF